MLLIPTTSDAVIPAPLAPRAGIAAGYITITESRRVHEATNLQSSDGLDKPPLDGEYATLAVAESDARAMPRYNYECKTCGPFEAWASIGMSDQPADCPSCGGNSERALAAPFVAGSRQPPAPVCGMGACGMCAAPSAD